MNRGILELALSGRVELELEYREPGTQEIRVPCEEPIIVKPPHGGHLQTQTIDEFACLLQVI